MAHEERFELLKKAFDSIHRDNNGLITYDELLPAFLKVGFTKQEVAQFVDYHDLDIDDKLNLYELYCLLSMQQKKIGKI
jgi:Ca2+-binding EF-hand superfamily protein